MTSLSALRRIQAELTSARVSFALVGGLAVSARTEPRFTRDADLATAVAGGADATSPQRARHRFAISHDSLAIDRHREKGT